MAKSKAQVKFLVNRNNQKVEAFKIVVEDDNSYSLKANPDITLTFEELKTAFSENLLNVIKSIK